MSHSTRKPGATEAMALLLAEINAVIPFDMPEAEICGGKCIGCPKKMLEFLATEVAYYQGMLARGETPLLGDISRLALIGKKVQRSLRKNGLLDAG